MYEDKTLICKDCGAEFVFTAGEQEFYAEKGFTNEPQRCKTCRDAKKRSMRDRDNNYRSDREMFTATCATCGGEAKIPFRPRDDRPVYCSDCFAKVKEQEQNNNNNNNNNNSNNNNNVNFEEKLLAEVPVQ